MKPATPITASADDYQIRAVAQKLERDREALMEALASLIPLAVQLVDEQYDAKLCDYPSGNTQEIIAAVCALSAARANFPTP